MLAFRRSFISISRFMSTDRFYSEKIMEVLERHQVIPDVIDEVPELTIEVSKKNEQSRELYLFFTHSKVVYIFKFFVLRITLNK